jgi:hypothetical protein
MDPNENNFNEKKRKNDTTLPVTDKKQNVTQEKN